MTEAQSNRLTVKCSCGAKLGVPIARAGRKIKCPKCGNLMVVPLSAPAMRPAQDAADETRRTPPASDSATGSHIRVQCACGASMGLPVSAAGRRAKCPKCASVFVVPLPSLPESKTDDAVTTPDLGSLIDDLAREERTAEAIV